MGNNLLFDVNTLTNQKSRIWEGFLMRSMILTKFLEIILLKSQYQVK